MSMWRPEEATADYGELFRAILDGQEKYPLPWTRRGRALGRWQ